MLRWRHWDWSGFCRLQYLFLSKVNKMSNTTTLYCSQSFVLFTVLPPPQLAPPFFSFLFFPPCVLAVLFMWHGCGYVLPASGLPWLAHVWTIT